MKEISSQYGDNVMVEFSGDGLQALAQDLQRQIQEGSWKLNQQQKTDQAKKQELMEQSIVQLENTHRLVIPNIQTNEKLYDSLENAPAPSIFAASYTSAGTELKADSHISMLAPIPHIE